MQPTPGLVFHRNTLLSNNNNNNKILNVSLDLGGSTRLESVGEDDELFVANGTSSFEMVEKPGRRKHSLPQQLDPSGVRQVSQCRRFFLPVLDEKWHERLPEKNKSE